MLTKLNDFDPIKFLEIDTSLLSTNNLSNFRKTLNSKIGEYILLKVSKYLTKKQLNKAGRINNGQKLFEMLKTEIPDLNPKIIEELENFKNEYQKVT